MVAIGTGSDNETVPPILSPAVEWVFARLQAAGLYFGHGTDNAWNEAVELVAAAVGWADRLDELNSEQALTTDERERIAGWLRRRIEERVPLPYLTGTAFFAGLPFYCDSRALVPRSPLAELILDDYQPWWSGPPPARILDLCCGGGCIGIAAALGAPEATVVLADIDPDALALAGRNIQRHGLAGRVSTCRSNLLQAVSGSFELVLSNPPYVDAEDIGGMPAEYRSEPLHALAAGDDGLDLALQILATAPARLAPAGLLFLELGNSWEALEALCPRLPLTWVEFANGGHGVLVATAAELQSWQPQFEALASLRSTQRV